jgi:glycosyltransferase involved in cell wall biosynthesis
MSSVALSVVIPTRNRADDLIRAVNSVLRGGNNIEVIVSDDGSTDDTIERVEALHDERVRIVGSPTSNGANIARNRGAAMAKAPVIAFLDSDDMFLEGRCERLMAFFRDHPEIDAVHDGFVEVSGDSQKIHAMPRFADARELRHLIVCHRVPMTNSAVTIRAAAFKAIGGFDEKLRRHQDRDLLLRINEKYNLALGSAADIHKFRGTASISHNFREYISGLDMFCKKIPETRMEYYEDLFRYLSIRGIIKSASQGRIKDTLHEINELSRARNLPHGLIRNLLRYHAGKAFRQSAPPPPN